MMVSARMTTSSQTLLCILVWIQSKDRNLENEVTVLSLLETYFPNTPVYVALGNHESMPVNMFPSASAQGTDVSVEWLYDGIANMSWANSLTQEERDLFRQNGFYSTLITEGLRLISLNTNFCQSENFYLFLDFSDPADMLAWLVQELFAAEQAGHSLSFNSF